MVKAQKLYFHVFVPTVLRNFTIRGTTDMISLLGELESVCWPRKGTCITALVYDGELAPVVRGNGYFDAIVSSRDLLGLEEEA